MTPQRDAAHLDTVLFASPRPAKQHSTTPIRHGLDRVALPRHSAADTAQTPVVVVECAVMGTPGSCLLATTTFIILYCY